MICKPETLEQIAFFDWIRLNPKIARWAFHVPNEGKRSKIMGSILNRMGMRAGVSDVFIAIPANGFHGMFIEMKAKNKKGIYPNPTSSQLIFHKDMMEKGYHCAVANGAIDAIDEVKSYLGLHAA